MWFWILAALLLLFVYMRFEASWLEVCRHTIPNRSGLRVAVLSDLHIVFCRISAQRIHRILEVEKPDLFVFLGDAIDKPGHIIKAVDWLKSANIGAPGVAILGNHDHKLFVKKPHLLPVYKETLRAAGIHLHINESFLFHTENSCVRITALDDNGHGTDGLPPSVSGMETGREIPLHLLLTHNPQRLVTVPEQYADFAVAGHFHGGQIWMPFGLEFRLFRKESLGRGGVRRGLHSIRGIPTWLTKGIGNVLFPLRLGARPELTLLDL